MKDRPPGLHVLDAQSIFQEVCSMKKQVLVHQTGQIKKQTSECLVDLC